MLVVNFKRSSWLESGAGTWAAVWWGRQADPLVIGERLDLNIPSHTQMLSVELPSALV